MGAGLGKIYPRREGIYSLPVQEKKKGKKTMKKNVMAEGEELRVNERLIPSELVNSQLLYNTVRICPFPGYFLI